MPGEHVVLGGRRLEHVDRRQREHATGVPRGVRVLPRLGRADRLGPVPARPLLPAGLAADRVPDGVVLPRHRQHLPVALHPRLLQRPAGARRVHRVPDRVHVPALRPSVPRGVPGRLGVRGARPADAVGALPGRLLLLGRHADRGLERGDRVQAVRVPRGDLLPRRHPAELHRRGRLPLAAAVPARPVLQGGVDDALRHGPLPRRLLLPQGHQRPVPGARRILLQVARQLDARAVPARHVVALQPDQRHRHVRHVPRRLLVRTRGHLRPAAVQAWRVPPVQRDDRVPALPGGLVEPVLLEPSRVALPAVPAGARLPAQGDDVARDAVDQVHRGPHLRLQHDVGHAVRLPLPGGPLVRLRVEAAAPRLHRAARQQPGTPRRRAAHVDARPGGGRARDGDARRRGVRLLRHRLRRDRPRGPAALLLPDRAVPCRLDLLPGHQALAVGSHALHARLLLPRGHAADQHHERVQPLPQWHDFGPVGHAQGGLLPRRRGGHRGARLRALRRARRERASPAQSRRHAADALAGAAAQRDGGVARAARVQEPALRDQPGDGPTLLGRLRRRPPVARAAAPPAAQAARAQVALVEPAALAGPAPLAVWRRRRRRRRRRRARRGGGRAAPPSRRGQPQPRPRHAQGRQRQQRRRRRRRRPHVRRPPDCARPPAAHDARGRRRLREGHEQARVERHAVGAAVAAPAAGLRPDVPVGRARADHVPAPDLLSRALHLRLLAHPAGHDLRRPLPRRRLRQRPQAPEPVPAFVLVQPSALDVLRVRAVPLVQVRLLRAAPARDARGHLPHRAADPARPLHGPALQVRRHDGHRDPRVQPRRSARYRVDRRAAHVLRSRQEGLGVRRAAQHAAARADQQALPGAGLPRAVH